MKHEINWIVVNLHPCERTSESASQLTSLVVTPYPLNKKPLISASDTSSAPYKRLDIFIPQPWDAKSIDHYPACNVGAEQWGSTRASIQKRTFVHRHDKFFFCDITVDVQLFVMSEERRSSEVGDTAHLLSDFEVANSNSRSSKAARLVDLFHIPRWPVVCRSWKQFLFFLLPTFIQSRVRPHQQTSNKAQLHPTAWLDGMRGLAAFFVFLDHLSYSNHDVYTAWGTGQGNREFLKLPLIRYFYTGAAQVAVFFVVSGYALSTKPVRLMRSGEKEKLFDTLCSSVFRRAIRLYLPCFASTLLIIFLVRLGAYDWTRDIANDAERFPIRREHHPWRYDTLSEQLTVWAKKMWSFCNPYTFEIREGDSAIDIDGHLWTIPVSRHCVHHSPAAANLLSRSNL